MSVRGQELPPPPDPVHGLVDSAAFTCVLPVAGMAPIQWGPEAAVTATDTLIALVSSWEEI